jgi:hypothetical protein
MSGQLQGFERSTIEKLDDDPQLSMNVSRILAVAIHSARSAATNLLEGDRSFELKPD